MNGGSIHVSIGDRTWRKPELGWLKLNIDAAVFQDGQIGVGCVLRDAQGQFVGPRCQKVGGAWLPREAEAISLNEALSWVIERRYDHCIVETDSKSFAMVCNGTPGEAFFGTIAVDCIQLLKHINPLVVQFAYRYANSVAHVLAKVAYSMSGLEVWYDDPPDFLIHALDSDIIY